MHAPDQGNCVGAAASPALNLRGSTAARSAHTGILIRIVLPGYLWPRRPPDSSCTHSLSPGAGVACRASRPLEVSDISPAMAEGTTKSGLFTRRKMTGQTACPTSEIERFPQINPLHFRVRRQIIRAPAPEYLPRADNISPVGHTQRLPHISPAHYGRSRESPARPASDPG